MNRIKVEITDADQEERKILSRLIREDRTLEKYADEAGETKDTEINEARGPDVIFRGSLAGKISEIQVLRRRGRYTSLTTDEWMKLYEAEIFDVFQKIGIPVNTKGHIFLKDAILLSLQREELLLSITKKMYPLIAGKHETTPNRVERAIRHAIEIAWERGSLKTAWEICGLTCPEKNGKPTNTEFISSMTFRLKSLYGTSGRKR